MIKRAPYGYDYTPDGNLVPIEHDLLLLEEVIKLMELDAISLRGASQYLSDEGSRYISHEGLRKRMQTEIRREL